VRFCTLYLGWAGRGFLSQDFEVGWVRRWGKIYLRCTSLFSCLVLSSGRQYFFKACIHNTDRMTFGIGGYIITG
jgi:hypothetical protein